MKTARMVIGIISMVLFLFVTFQSCAVGLGNTLAENGEASGTAGLLLALSMLIAGILGVAGRKSKPCTIVAGAFYALGGIIGIANIGTFADLQIWSILSFIFAVFFIISGVLQKNNVQTPEA